MEEDVVVEDITLPAKLCPKIRSVALASSVHFIHPSLFFCGSSLRRCFNSLTTFVRMTMVLWVFLFPLLFEDGIGYA